MDDKIKIDIQNLNFFIGKQQILKNINTQIPQNKITAIIGPSGCGKTTLLKCVNRLTDLYPQARINGKILIDKDDILNTKEDITKIRRRCGLLSQRPYPLPMSIYKNITFGLTISGRSRKLLQHKRVEYYLRLVNLWDEVKERLHEPASSLSIGQQQRLCLARGLAVGPQIILADEPTSALDPISNMAIEDKFRELKQQYTIVLVTHFLEQAKRLADYVIFMYLGEIVEQGTVAEIFGNPKQQRTKDYVAGAFN